MGKSNVKIEFDEGEWAKLEKQANDAGKQILRDVNASHSGKPAEQVRAELESRFHKAGFMPSEPTFTEYVDAIADGTLED